MSLERDLKQAFERHSGDVRPSTDPLGEATDRLERSRRRRATGYALGAVALAAALGIALPKLLGRQGAQTIKPGPTPTQKASGFETIRGPIQDIQLVAPGQGWIVQNGDVYFTSDSGASWNTVETANPSDPGVVAAYAIPGSMWSVWPDTTGDPRGAARLLIKHSPLPEPCLASQGGCDIEEIRTATINSVGFGPVSVFFVDVHRGWILADLGGGSGVDHGAQLFTTTDGGKHWRELPRPPSLAPTGIQYIAFGDTEHGLITDGAHVYRTTNAGASWTLVDPTRGRNVRYNCQTPSRTYGRPHYFSSTSAIIPSGAGCPIGSVEPEIYETRDAGNTWHYSARFLVPGTDEMVLSTPTNDMWFAWIGTKHLYETTDAGAHWQQLTSDLPRHVLQMTFVDGQDGWASVSRDGCSGDVRGCTDVYQTSDGARSWNLITVAVRIPTPYCKASALASQVFEQAGNGRGQFIVTVTNKSNVDCLAASVPISIQLIRSDGSVLPTEYRRSTGTATGNFFPVLQPGAPTQLVTFWWANWCTTPPGRITIRISLETVANPEILAVTFSPTYVPRCDRPGSPSTITPELDSSVPPSP